MNKLELYESVLLQLAQAGSPEAKLALELGSKIQEKSIQVSEVASDLRCAVDSCGGALRHNGYEWTSKTDDDIRNALNSITRALSKLI